MTVDQPFEACIVRLWNKSQEAIVGAGFLVTEKHVLTCAHVIADALGFSRNDTKQPTEKVYLDFILLDKNKKIKAQVVVWHPISDDNSVSDIAVLELFDTLPNQCQPVSLLENNISRNNPFLAYGFPKNYDDIGFLVDGIIVGKVGNSWLQVRGYQQGAGYGIVSGFSGSPLWDEEKKAFIGMVVAADDRQDNSIAFFIPTNILIKAWYKLCRYCRHPQKRLPPKPKSIPPLLPYLPDRGEQERYLGKAIQRHANKQQPLLCVVHGNHYERGDKFLERLKQDYLPKVDATFNDLQSYFFNCETCSHHVDELHDVLRESLGDQVLNNPLAKCDDIANRIAQDNSPVILYTNMCTKDWCRGNGTKVIYEFIKFWADWPISTQNHLFMVFLFFNYKDIKTKWFFKPSTNRKIRKVFEELQETDFLEKFRVHGVVLPELLKIEIEHVENWINMYASHYCDPDFLHQEVNKIFTSVEQKIAMQPLAYQLKKILKKCEQDYTD
jgi:hypothetical protein